MKKVLIENLVKNAILIVILLLAYIPIKEFFLEIDDAYLGDVLLTVSILIVTACFGNFAFSYERIEGEKFSHRIIAHLTTGFLMLSIGLLLEIVQVLISREIGSFWIFEISILLIYAGTVGFDFWDVLRLKDNKTS